MSDEIIKSKYRGVTFDRLNAKWLAQIVVAGKPRTLGRFDPDDDGEKEAAILVDNARIWLQAFLPLDACKLNFLDGEGQDGERGPVKRLRKKLESEKAKPIALEPEHQSPQRQLEARLNALERFVKSFCSETTERIAQLRLALRELEPEEASDGPTL